MAGGLLEWKEASPLICFEIPSSGSFISYNIDIGGGIVKTLSVSSSATHDFIHIQCNLTQSAVS